MVGKDGSATASMSQSGCRENSAGTGALIRGESAE